MARFLWLAPSDPSADRRSPRHEGLFFEELDGEAAQEGRDRVALAKESINLPTPTGEQKRSRGGTGGVKHKITFERQPAQNAPDFQPKTPLTSNVR